MVAILDINITLQQITASPSNEQPFAIFFYFFIFYFLFFFHFDPAAHWRNASFLRNNKQ